jgi:hypothetical protein
MMDFVWVSASEEELEANEEHTEQEDDEKRRKEKI